jgi:cytochrome c biogenesis protein CcmG, thiol:disulfide interchange protein DsbE
VKRALALAPLLALAVIVLAAAFLLIRGGQPQTITSGLLGRPAPAYALARLGGGEPVTNANTAGRAYVINMFASWCTPCRAEHSVLMALKANGVQIIGVAYKDRPEAAAGFLRALGDPYDVAALDPDGRFALQLGTTGVPETFVIAADGTIHAIHRGPLTADVVERTIMPALAAR